MQKENIKFQKIEPVAIILLMEKKRHAICAFYAFWSTFRQKLAGNNGK